jgi:hypothetical protein
MNMQELKKKTYAIGTGGIRFRDPIKFVSKLNSSKRCINEIRIPLERGDYCQTLGFQVIEDYYGLHDVGSDNQESQDEPHAARIFFPAPKKLSRLHQGPVQVYHPPEVPKEGQSNQAGSKKSPMKSANKFKFKEEVVSSIPSNTLFELAIQGAASVVSPQPGSSQTQEAQPQQSQLLGKRMPNSSPHSQDDAITPVAVVSTRVPTVPSLTIGSTPHPQRGKYLCPRTGVYYSTLEDFKLLRQLKAREQLLLWEKEAKYIRAHTELKRRKMQAMLEDELHAN